MADYIPSVTLNGKDMPAIGLGTWRSAPDVAKEAVLTALKNGYTHLDCAWSYQNEAIVGQAIVESGIPRDTLWITSKLFNNAHRPEHARLQLQETLKNLQCGYLDLWLMHWPLAFDTSSYSADELPPRLPKDAEGVLHFDLKLTDDFLLTWKAMEEAQKQGLVKNIGVSNFNKRKLQILLDKAEIKPSVNQVEASLAFPQHDLQEFCEKNNIIIQAYAPLGSQGSPLLQEPLVTELAGKYKVNAANVLVSYLVQRGMVALPKSVTKERIISNLKYVDLTAEDLKKLDQSARSRPRKRLCEPHWSSPESADMNPFEEEEGRHFAFVVK